MARPRKNPKTVENTCEYCGKEFEIKYQKRTQRFCSKKCSSASPKTKRKIVESQLKTFREKYGVDHPMQTKKTLQRFKDSMFKKYGVEHALQNADLYAKAVKTKESFYEDENYNNSEKRKQTCVTKYGVENYRQSSEYAEKYKETCMKKYGVDHASKSDQFVQNHKKLMFNKFLSSDRFKNFIPLFSFEEYMGLTHGQSKCPFECTRCGNSEKHDIGGGKDLKCSKCDKTSISSFQSDIYNFVTSLLPGTAISQNDRTLLYPKEIDIIIPHLKLGIECNSLIFHSEVFGNKNKLYHLHKTQAALKKEFAIIHIADYEWKFNQPIIKYIIKRKLKTLNNNKDSIIVKEISSLQSKEFLSSNHLNGYHNSDTHFGAFVSDELISVLSVSKCKFPQQSFEYEVDRLCPITTDVLYENVENELIKYFIKNYSPKSIQAFSNRKYFSGDVFHNMGFKFIQNTDATFMYTSGYSDVIPRHIFQKNKLHKILHKFDPNISEWENMKNHGFDRIWDCGNSKWIWTSKTKTPHG